MKIGLTLSGGGFRATVFHLGVLARLADSSRLEDVAFLSTVSGGSLCAALVYAGNNATWPTSRQLIDQVIPQARQLLTTVDLERTLIWRVLRDPLSVFLPRANSLSTALQEYWGLTGKLSNLGESPRWLINATCYETGKNWRFESFRMGDYVFGYTYDTQLPISDAVAASCGFPGLIGALPLDTIHSAWFNYVDMPTDISSKLSPEHQLQRKTEPIKPAYSTVHLWDGGAYDNFGLEGVFDIEKGWRGDVEFLIASDASGGSKPEAYQPGPRALLRIITGVMMPQIRALRARSFMERIINHQDPGAFLEMGRTCEYVLKSSAHKDEIDRLCAQCLPKEEVDLAAATPTTIRRLTPEEFERLFRHGYEVADYTLYGYHSDQFQFIGYGNSRWGQGSAAPAMAAPSP